MRSGTKHSSGSSGTSGRARRWVMIALAGTCAGIACAQEAAPTTPPPSTTPPAAQPQPGQPEPADQPKHAGLPQGRFDANKFQPRLRSSALPAGGPSGGELQPAPGEPGPAGGMSGTAGGTTVVASGNDFQLGPFSEPVDVRLLVELVQSQLHLQIISTDQALRDKKFMLPSAITLPKEQLLPFLQSVLDQNGQMLVQDVAGIYFIKAVSEKGGFPGGEAAATQIVSTKGMRPSALQSAINAAMVQGAGGGQPGPTGAPGGPMAYMDDLGVIVVTDTPRRIGILRALIDQLAQVQQDADLVRYDLKHIAAKDARARLLELSGQLTRGASLNPNDPNAAAQAAQQGTTPGGGGALSNLSARLIVDPQGNALLFRGRLDERVLLDKLVPIVDSPYTLMPRFYPINGAIIIAEQAKLQGMGEVRVMRSLRTGEAGGVVNPSQTITNGGVGQNTIGSGTVQDLGGPVFIVDPDGRGFTYYATSEQHERLEQLVREMREATSRDEVVYEFYKLKHASAKDAAELIRGLISNTVQGGSSSLLPGGGSSGTGGRTGQTVNTRRNTPNMPTSAQRPTGGGSMGGDLEEISTGDDVFVLADEPNNQIVVKAPKRTQPQFARLIERIDLRRAQVYIEAKIVTVSADESTHLAVETQLVNVGSSNISSRTFFPGNATTAGNINIAPAVSAVASGGLTAALIKSDKVPIVLTALASTNDARIIATPQLLVDDNEEAELASIEQRPTSTTTQSSSAGSTQTSFGGYEDAGPKLKVKPRISSTDSMSLKYDIELSSFSGAGGSGLPPPKQKNNVRSESVTVPSDSTIVVGGLVLDSNTDTVAKVPLLGDIPLLGQLFRDDTKASNKRILYIFITPRVMRDANFEGSRLNTVGPMSSVKIPEPLPAPTPTTIDIVSEPPKLPPAPPASAPAPSPAPSDAVPADIPVGTPPSPAQRPAGGWVAPKPKS